MSNGGHFGKKGKLRDQMRLDRAVKLWKTKMVKKHKRPASKRWF